MVQMRHGVHEVPENGRSDESDVRSRSSQDRSPLPVPRGSNLSSGSGIREQPDW
jgi:hypothetical protein